MDFFTAGESHGHIISGLINGFPAGVFIDVPLIEGDLKKRRSGSGRSERMTLENDSFTIESGVINKITTGAPILFTVENSEGVRFFDNRITEKMFPRPGHVDLSSFMKFGYSSVNIGSERSSARETVAHVVAGSFSKMFLKLFNVSVTSDIVEIGGNPYPLKDSGKIRDFSVSNGTLGGLIHINAVGVVPGIGSNAQWYDKLDSVLAARIMAIPSVKGIYIGDTDQHRLLGKDVIGSFDNSFVPLGSKTGGIDGGISNGDTISVSVFLKPIPSQPFPVESINCQTGEKGAPDKVRSDLWAVESASVILESSMAFVLADMYCRKFGSDYIDDIFFSYRSYINRIKWRSVN